MLDYGVNTGHNSEKVKSNKYLYNACILVKKVCS